MNPLQPEWSVAHEQTLEWAAECTASWQEDLVFVELGSLVLKRGHQEEEKSDELNQEVSGLNNIKAKVGTNTMFRLDMKISI